MIPTQANLAKSIASTFGLDPAIFCGLVERESSWDNWSIRYEPEFFVRYIHPLNLKDATEAEARAFSWGPCQVMGQLARELNYAGPLPQLCDWNTGLEWGARALEAKLRVAGNMHLALLRYNGGSNPNYADEVEALAAHYRA